MKLLQYEAKKMLFYHGGALIFCLYLLVQIGMLFAGDTPHNLEAQQYAEDYRYYLEQVDGAWTQKKADWLESEAELIDDAEDICSNAWQEYYDGTLSYEALQAKVEPYEALLNRKNGFDVLYNQYLYICEGKENRAFLETNGWEGLLDTGMLDFPLLIALILLIVPVFCSEYICKMDMLALTTQNGQKSYLRYKLLVVGIAVAALCISEAALRYGFYALRYGLPHSNYGIQSLQAFGESTKNLTLLQAFLLVSGSRLFGGVYFAAFTLAVSAWCRQYGLTVLISTASVLVPWIGLSEQMQYQFPLSLPFLLATGFLKGGETVSDSLDGEKMVVFSEISFSQLRWLLIECTIIFFICVLIIWWKHHTTLSKHRVCRSLGLIPLFLLLFILSGCAENASLSESICYNTTSSTDFYTSEFHIYYDEEETQPMVEFLSTGERVPLNRDPLQSAKDVEIGRYFFVDGDSVYYTTISTDTSAEKGISNAVSNTLFSLRRVNLNTFEEQIVYEHQWQNEVLGITLTVGEGMDMLLIDNMFFVSGKTLYVVENKLYRIDLAEGKVDILDISLSHNVAFDGTYIYYVNDKYMLSYYNTKSGEMMEWEDIVVKDFCMVGDMIYYINLRDHNHLYSINCDGTENQMALETPLISVSWDGKEIHLVDQNKSEFIFGNTA